MRLRKQWFPGLLLTMGMMLSLLLSPVMAQQEIPDNTITTQGTGEVRVKPDSLRVSATVETSHARLETAREENNRKMQAVINALRALGIPGMQLETQNLHIYPVTGEQRRDRLPETVGYRVINSLNVTVRGARPEQLAEYGSRIVDTALNSGANNVSGLSFFLDDMNAARRQALQNAVNDARQNAQALAGAAGVTISGVHSIEGVPEYGGFPPPMPLYAARAADTAESQAVPVEAGEMTVTARVTVRYRF